MSTPKCTATHLSNGPTLAYNMRAPPQLRFNSNLTPMCGYISKRATLSHSLHAPLVEPLSFLHMSIRHSGTPYLPPQEHKA